MNKTIALHNLSQMTEPQTQELLKRAEDDLSYFIKHVAPIIAEVRKTGDVALAKFAAQFDKAPSVSADHILVEKKAFDAAFDALDPAFIKVLEYAADNIRRFHEHQKPEPLWMTEIRPGVHVGEKTTPIDSVALYSPRGKGSFPSVTLMTAIPAVVAGVPNPIILTPPGPDGQVDPATLVAARLAGVEMVARAGGAQAVAAAAFGTQSIPKCQKIEGPGSPWFMAAKQVLANEIDSRLPAGPSEVIILADPSANPALAALDILIESEHGSDSSGFLVTWSRTLAEAVIQQIPEFLAQMSDERAGFAMDVLSGTNGGVVLADGPEQAYQFINAYAPEHLQILSRNPEQHLPHIINAAEILLGDYTPGSLANYMMGPNCVLPTAGAAMRHSPLGVADFVKRTSIGRVDAAGFAEMAPKTEIFARYEGFDAHANAVSALRGKYLK